jgi:CRISPR/Cas system-associated exonuclease Cas4 (RecB family)
MTKNLLRQVMVKGEPKPKKKESSFSLDGLVAKINYGYIAKNKPKHQTKKTFAPSIICYSHGECPRYWYLAFSGAVYEDKSDASGVANRTNGTYGHKRIQEALINSGIAKVFQGENKETGKICDTTELKISNENPPIFGYGDAILNWNDEEVILEIKTIPNEGFEYRKNTGKAKKDHILQTLIYMKILGHKRGIILYENKNNHELLPILIEVNDYYREYINNAFEWMKTVRASWMKNEFPIKNYRSNSKICKGCPVQKACDEAGAGVVKISSLEELRETM